MAISAVAVPASVVGIWARFADRPDIMVAAFTVFLVAAGIGGIGPGLDFWRGESYRSRQVLPPPRWRFSPGLWRANLRTTVVMADGALPGLAFMAAIVGVLDTDWLGPAEELPFAGPLILAAVVYWIALIAVTVSVALTNTPARLVPPHLRALPGYLDDDIHDPEVGAEIHRTPSQLGLQGNYPRDPDR